MVNAAPLERVVDFAGAVGGDNDDGFVFGGEGAKFGDGDLVVGEEFEEEAFKLFVGTVEFVYEEDGGLAVTVVEGLE